MSRCCQCGMKDCCGADMEEAVDRARFMAAGWRRLAKRLLRIHSRVPSAMSTCVHCGVQSAEDREDYCCLEAERDGWGPEPKEE